MTLARKQFDVNYFGVLQVNEIALPLLRRTAARNRKRGRVIVVGSIGGRLGLPFNRTTLPQRRRWKCMWRRCGWRGAVMASPPQSSNRVTYPLDSPARVSSPNQPIHRTTTNANVRSGKWLMTSRPATVRKAWPESSSRRSANAIPGAHRRRQQLQGPDATQALPPRSPGRIRHASYLYEALKMTEEDTEPSVQLRNPHPITCHCSSSASPTPK